jgi:hypothetical protein
VFKVQFLGRPTIVKQRFSKKYRHPTLDAKLTLLRLKQAGAVGAMAFCMRHLATVKEVAASLSLCEATAAE